MDIISCQSEAISNCSALFVVSFSSGKNMVSEPALQDEKDHEERGASSGSQPEFQRPNGLQFATVPRSMGLARSAEASQPPESAKH